PAPYADEVAAPSHPVQGSLDELGTPLAATTFVVVDLETTGARPGEAAITEIGAVRLRDGRVLDEFSSLVNPQTPVPASVTLLTGITTAMVESAPPAAAVLPAFLEFAGFGPDTVLVAHNAPFDVALLNAACASHGMRWPSPAPPRACCAACWPGCAPAAWTPGRSCGRCAARPPPSSAADGTWPTGCPRPRGSTSSRTPRAPPSTSARASTCAPGCAPTSPPRNGGPGSGRWWASPRGSGRSCARPPWRPRSANSG